MMPRVPTYVARRWTAAKVSGYGQGPCLLTQERKLIQVMLGCLDVRAATRGGLDLSLGISERSKRRRAGRLRSVGNRAR
jgi:hypothetical protein